MRLVKFLIPFFAFVLSKQIYAQCINTFPHTETFESSASWTSGGTNTDWAWGTPSKAIITGAGGGSKCWIIGGLNGSSYNGAEKSYIESPCYDLSTLTAPYVSFKVFWEMEYKYDGANLAYSLNNGASWIVVGSFNDPANCMTQNWYNYGSIINLTWASGNGWSGNSKTTSGSCQGGNGSLGWVIATHCLSGLAGQANVKFRFNFGSGTTCNAFDGFAVDDFTIGNAGNNSTSFTYTCSNFSVATPTCTQGLQYQWNFGDQTSGSANTSTLSNPTHAFTQPGLYTVSLTTTGGACNAVASSTQIISVVGSSVTNIKDVSCFGGHNGSATVLPLFGNPAYTYTWLPSGGNAATANSLSAGNYTILIADSKGCINSQTVSITEPEISTGQSTQTLTNCLGDNTLLQVSVTGVTDPVSYLWSPGSFTSNSIYVSPNGNTVYSVNVVISGNCPQSEQKLFTVMVVPKPIVASSNSGLSGCGPLCIDLSDKSTTASGTIVKNLWSFSTGENFTLNNPTVCFTVAGTYTGAHSVTNSYGCTTTANDFIRAVVYPSPVSQFIADKKETTELDPQIKFKDLSTGGATEWEWNFGGTAVSNLKDPAYNFAAIGQYPVLLTVSNEFGCNNTSMQLITILPEFTFYAPNAFTPNGDGLNDVFLPQGMGWDVTNYTLTIFDRWGQKIFYTTDHTKGWDGTIKESETKIGEYIYKALVYDNAKKLHEYSGFVSIIK